MKSNVCWERESELGGIEDCSLERDIIFVESVHKSWEEKRVRSIMPHFTTILAQSPKGVLNALAGLHKKYSGHTLLFALSSNSPELSELVARLTTFSKRSVGCLSAQAQEGTICCSLAFFDSQYATTFRSVIPGRAAPQVGRWHSFKKPDSTPDMEFDQTVDWEDVWSKSVGNHPLPEELQGTRFVVTPIFLLPIDISLDQTR